MGLPPLSMGPVIPPPEVYRGPPGAGRSGISGVSGGGEVVYTKTTTLLDPPRSPRLKCFGSMSLRTACVGIGVGGCVGNFINFVMGLVVVTQNQSPERDRDDSSRLGANMINDPIIGAILDVILIIGARTRSRCLCLSWFLAQLIALIIVIIFVISGRGFVEDVVSSLFPIIYSMVVVACYIKELERTDLVEEQGLQGRTVMMMTDLPSIITTQRYDPFPSVEATVGTATQSGAGYYGENFGSSYGPPPLSYQAWRLENHPVVANLKAEQPQVHYPAFAGSLA